MFSCWFDSQSLAIVVPSKSLLSCSSKLVRQYKFFWPSLILNRTFFTDGEDVGCPGYRSWINLEEVLSNLGLGWSWLVWADLGSLGVNAVKNFCEWSRHGRGGSSQVYAQGILYFCWWQFETENENDEEEVKSDWPGLRKVPFLPQNLGSLRVHRRGQGDFFRYMYIVHCTVCPKKWIFGLLWEIFVHAVSAKFDCFCALRFALRQVFFFVCLCMTPLFIIWIMN